MPVRISYKQKNFRDLFQQIIQKKRVQFKSVDLEVKKIIANVIKNGDDSLVRFAKQYDHFKLSKKNIKFSKSEINNSVKIKGALIQIGNKKIYYCYWDDKTIDQNEFFSPDMDIVPKWK